MTDYHVESADGYDLDPDVTFTAFFADGTKVEGRVREIDPNPDYNDNLGRAVAYPVARGTLKDGREFAINHTEGCAWEAGHKNRQEFEAIVKEENQ